MRRPRTLRARLALVGVLTAAAWVALLTVGFNVVLTRQLNEQSTSLLHQRAAAAAATVQLLPSGSIHVVDPADDEALDANLWIYEGRTAIERPRAGRALQDRADGLADRGELSVRISGAHPVRLFALPVRFRGAQVATVVCALSLDPYEHVARLAVLASAALALLLLVGVYATMRVVVQRALLPVQDMSAQAARWSALDASQRFGSQPRPAELSQLAHNLDGVLERLAALLRHEQQVTEELSHELRTPLSLITAEVDLVGSRRRSAGELTEAVSRIGAGATHMQTILETLLTTARSRSPDTAGRCTLMTAVTEAVSNAPEQLHVVVSGESEVAAAVDAAVVERILAPLLENAARYARERTDVAVTTDPAAGVVVVRIWDDGPGVDPSLADSVFEPGRRDASTSPHGAGLGLALARRLARAAGGELLLCDGAFELRLPGA